MGLSIYLHVDCHAIDDERWEAAYLTSLQLLEQFPGPLARCVREAVGRVQRWVVTKNIICDIGSPEEHWEIDRELGSGRSAEPCSLYRHVQHYRAETGKRGRKAPGTAGDVLRLRRAADEEETDWYAVGGYRVFDGKTQGYPYHYAVLAVGMLLESCFPRHALVRGAISRRQAEQTAAWAASVLGRRLPLPLVTDGPRLWKRLTEADPSSPPLDNAVRRLRALLVDGDEAALRVLDKYCPDPRAVRRVYVQELDRYQTLRQRGAAALIRTVCNVDGDIQRAIDWACGPRDSTAAGGQEHALRRFTPEELLETLCGSLITVPLHERELLDMFKPPPDALTNIEELFGQLLLTMSGMPETVAWFMDEKALLAEFVRRWPERERALTRTWKARLKKVRRFCEQGRHAIERLEGMAEELGAQAETWEPLADGGGDEPAAEFLRTEMLRQRGAAPGWEDAVRELGRQMQTALRANSQLRKSLERGDRPGTLERIYCASFDNGIALPEHVWREIDTLQDLNVLHALLLLVMCAERESSFCRCRQRLLEAPNLWPLLVAESR